MNTYATSPPSDPDEKSDSHLPFPLVGIGASAGGLEALASLFEHLLATTGMAYVVVQHLDPTHQSILPSLLARVTSLPVSEVLHDSSAEIDHVYVIPAGMEMILDERIFRLTPRKQIHGPLSSIDLFLRSLAQSQGSQAIGVILSGTGSDGAAGLQAIKEVGGMTFAQEPESASFSGMPHSAITAGSVDMILPPDQIAIALAQLSHHSYLKPHSVVNTKELPDKSISTIDEKAFQKILHLLHDKGGVDFTLYKTTTLHRRVLRRMALSRVDDPGRYLTLLQDHQEEVEALYRDVLISVTSFFRDPPTFALLKRLVLPQLMAQKPSGAPIRVWVPGCATGEEVYSLAICLLEFFAERSHPLPPVQLFGTDVHPTVIEQARTGIYSLSALSRIDPARLQHFFSKVNGTYQVTRAVRDLCVFAQHNVCQDPPFSRLDLISCCNMLIYFSPAAQNKVFQILHYALNPEGVLVLGSSETVGHASDLFAPLEKKYSVYLRKTITPHATYPRFSMHRSQEESQEHVDPTSSITPDDLRVRGGDALKEADRVLLARYAPASVVIDSQLEILQFRGAMRTFLEPAAGRASLHLLKMARAGLGLPLRTAIQQVRKSGVAIKKEHICLSGSGIDGTECLVTLEVLPLKASSPDPCFLVLFEARDASLSPAPTPSQPVAPDVHTRQRGVKDRRIQHLELELGTIRQEMQSLIEEREAANEELQSANEEILSSNEELQSLNEELETSKEEIQSTNEELLVVNEELRQRNEQLSEAHTYAEAIIETMGVPLLILNADFRVLRANHAFYQYFQVEPSATEHQVLYALGNGQWSLPALRALLEDILPQNHAFEGLEVTHQFPLIGRKILLLNARRLTLETNASLILLAFEDVTARMELSQRKDAFIGMASHELKTPLTSLKTYIYLLQQRWEHAADERSTTILTKIDTQLDALVRLIDEMLDITHMEKGVLSFHEATFDLTTLVAEVVEAVRLTTERHQIRTEGEGPIQISADRERTGQVLANLLTNAIKYMPQGGEVVVRWEAEEEKITLSVQDHGIGIPQEHQAHIFERFYRAVSESHQTIAGLGLGLYLSAEIVTRQGGEIWVKSREREGSTFFFTLKRERFS